MLLLDELRTAAVDVGEAEVPSIARSLLHVGDLFLNRQDEGLGLFSIPQVWLVDHAIDAFLDRLPADERAPLLEGALQTSSSLATLSFVVFSMAREHGRHTDDSAKLEDQRRLTEAEVIRLEELLAKRLALAAADHSLLKAPLGLSLMFYWATLAGDDAVKAWTDDLLADNKATVLLAPVVTATHKVQAGDDPPVIKTPSVNRRSLSQMLDVDRLADRLRALEPEADDEARASIARFMDGLESTDRGDDV